MKAWVVVAALGLLPGACALAPLRLYTLGTPPMAAATVPLGRTPEVVAVARVTLPDELDTEDIAVLDGDTLRRSSLGRWASRLSLGVTDRLTLRLAERWPDLLVTDRPLTETPSVRVLVNLGRLEVNTTGDATLDADWQVVPRDPGSPVVRQRGHFSAAGPVATDADVVRLIGALVDQLAGAIGVGGSGR